MLALPEHQLFLLEYHMALRLLLMDLFVYYLSKSIDFILHRFAPSCKKILALEGNSCIKTSVCRFA